MFCTSLRKRVEWATVPNMLLSSESPRWIEQTLTTYDLAIPLPQPDHQLHQDSVGAFLLLALSASDLQDQDAAMSRIQHLYHHNGGRNVGILFLLSEKSPQGNGAVALMNLQLGLLSTLDLPFIPLSSISALQSTVSAFQRQVVHTCRVAPAPEPNPAVVLLPYCSNNPPLPEHARNVLSDICHSLPQVANLTTSAEGKQELLQWLEDRCPGVAAEIIDFWALEIFVD